MLKNRALLLLLGTLCLTFDASPASGLGSRSKPEPSEAAFRILEKLAPRRLGTDRSGNLWYSLRSGLVGLLSPAGTKIGQAQIQDLLAVAADESWGVAGLLKDGRELIWQQWDGTVAARFPLSGPASDICWIDSKTVAVSPQMNSHRIEIWDLERKVLVRSIGTEAVIEPGPGMTRMRAVLLAFDAERQRLFSLESFTGDLRVFTLDGKLDWRGQVENPERKDTEDWLKENDARARAIGDVQTPVIFHFSLVLPGDGSVWTISQGAVDRREVTRVRLTSDGAAAAAWMDVACPSRNIALWGNQVIFYGVPKVGHPSCLSRKEIR